MEQARRWCLNWTLRPFPPRPLLDHAPLEATAGSLSATAAAVIYTVAFVTGAIVMSFEMLGSRYLNPYFGSGIYTWAALISTVLIALTAGYFLGGALADRTPSAAVLALTVIVGSLYLLALPSFAQAVLEFVLASIDDIRAGSLVSALALMFFPVTFLGMYSPFAIRLLLRSAQHSGRVSGAVYGISTAGSIVGTLGTTFVLIPTIGSRAITLMLGALGLVAGLALLALVRPPRSPSSRSRRWPRRPPEQTAWSTKASARRCWHVPAVASPISKPSTTTSSSPGAARSS